MRNIKRLVVHCTDTSPEATVQAIRDGFARRGWKNPGYHFLIDAKGTTHPLLPITQIANGAKGYNATSIHLCYIGGRITDKSSKRGYRNADTRTEPQRRAIGYLLKDLAKQFPKAKIVGHRDLNPHKGCPLFDVKGEWGEEVG